MGADYGESIDKLARFYPYLDGYILDPALKQAAGDLSHESEHTCQLLDDIDCMDWGEYKE